LIDLDKFSAKQAKCDLPERISSLRSLIAKGWVLLKASHRLRRCGLFYLSHSKKSWM
jgi:hypothetical protein